MAEIIRLPRARTEEALFGEIVAIVQAGNAGRITREQALRDSEAVLRCFPAIQRREVKNA